MNLFIKQKQTHRHRKQTHGYQRRRVGAGGGGINWEYGTDRCTLPYIKQINDKHLLLSTRKYIQCLEINYTGKETLKKNTYIYMHN